MRGIPQRFNTKQDLFNVCNDLHHAEARALLKALPEEELKRLGVTSKEIKKIRADLASRKRQETMANRELAAARQKRAEIQGRMADLRAVVETKTEELKRFVAGRDLIEPGIEELKELHKELAALRELPGRVRGVSAVCRDLGGVLAEFGAIEKVARGADLERLQTAAALVAASSEAIAALRDELAQARVAGEQKARVAALQARIDEKSAEVKALQEGVSRTDDIEREVEGLGRMIAALEAAEAETEARINDIKGGS